MAEQTSGIDLMRRRMERASRQPPPPRRARAAAPAAEEGGEPAATALPPRAATPAPAAGAPSHASAPPPPSEAGAPTAARVRLAADLPPVNLAIRVRKPLDDRLAEIIHALRREGVRTSKVELVEMLLWELPDDDLVGVRERLRAFRGWAPRGAGAPLDAAG